MPLATAPTSRPSRSLRLEVERTAEGPGSYSNPGLPPLDCRREPDGQGDHSQPAGGHPGLGRPVRGVGRAAVRVGRAGRRRRRVGRRCRRPLRTRPNAADLQMRNPSWPGATVLYARPCSRRQPIRIPGWHVLRPRNKMRCHAAGNSRVHRPLAVHCRFGCTSPTARATTCPSRSASTSTCFMSRSVSTWTNRLGCIASRSELPRTM